MDLPFWAWLLVGVAVLLGAAKSYDAWGRRRGHLPGRGGEPQVDWDHYQPPSDGAGGFIV